MRLVIGARDIANNTVEVMRRDTLEKETVSLDGIEDTVVKLLDDIQSGIFNKALKHREECTYTVDTWEDFKAQIEKGGFVLAHWDGTTETEEKIKEETKATIRCIPMDSKEEEGKCIYTGKPSHRRVIFARNY